MTELAEGARLEIVCTATYRGFESLPLRHKPVDEGTMLLVLKLVTQNMVGFRAIESFEPCQVLTEAALRLWRCAAELSHPHFR